MNLASINALLIILTVSLTTSSSGLFQAASAFIQITSPSKNEAVPAGSTLEVSGTSDDNTQFNCKIQVLVNGKHPYQDAIPAAGPGDYSKWSFTITPQYTEIEPGLNKITSKATCDAPYEPFLVQDPITKQFVKFYSINVTGTSSSPGDSVPFSGPPSASPEEQNGGDEANGANDGGEGNEENPSDGELFE